MSKCAHVFLDLRPGGKEFPGIGKNLKSDKTVILQNGKIGRKMKNGKIGRNREDEKSRKEA